MGNIKKCNTCKQDKSIKDFYRQPNGLLGRTGSCKACRKVYQKQYCDDEEIKVKRKIARKTHKCEAPEEKRKRYEKFKENNPDYWKDYYSQNREIRLEANKRFWKNNPDRYESYKAYKRGLGNGTIVRAQACMMCGLKCKTIGHHHDYSKPLEVIWVCHECHMSIHKKHKFMKKK